jgi:hypothetical protein
VGNRKGRAWFSPVIKKLQGGDGRESYYLSIGSGWGKWGERWALWGGERTVWLEQRWRKRDKLGTCSRRDPRCPHSQMRTLLHQRDGGSYHIPFSTDVTGRVTRKWLACGREKRQRRPSGCYSNPRCGSKGDSHRTVIVPPTSFLSLIYWLINSAFVHLDPFFANI